MRRTAIGWMAALMVIAGGLISVSEANAGGLDFLPLEDESRGVESISSDERELRQRLAELRQRSGDETASRDTRGDEMQHEQRLSRSAGDEPTLPGSQWSRSGPQASARSVDTRSDMIRALQTIDAVPDGRALEPSLHIVMAADELNLWEFCGKYTFVAHGGQGSVIDDGGKRLAQIDSPDWSRCVGGVLAVGSDAHHLSVFDAQRQRWRHARLHTPAGVEITGVHKQEIEGSQPGSHYFLVDLRTDTEERFLGIWDPAQRDVELQPSPFSSPVQARDLGDRVRVVSVEYNDNGRRVSTVSDMNRDGVQRLHRQTGGEAAILEDGWVVTQSGSAGQIVSPHGQVRDWEIQGCDSRAALWRTYREPASALMSCRSEHEGRERFKYWTPDDSQSWEMERDYRRRSSGSKPLMEMGQPVASRIGPHRDDPAGLWFDFIGGVMWRGEQLLPAYYWNRPGVPRTFLATDVALGEESSSARRALYLIDAEAGTQQPVATYDDCPGFLRTVDQTDSAVIIHCVSRDSGGAYRFQYHWSEFIDLYSGDWWRTSSREIRKFGPQGRLVVTNRSEGADYHWTMATRLYMTEPMVDPR